MNNLIVIIALTQETCFDSYTKFMCRDSDISLTPGTIIELGNIDCKILKELPGKLFEVYIGTSIVEKFANNLKCSLDDCFETLADIEGEEDESEFYLDKINFYHSLLKQYLFEHNLCECHTCKDYINLDTEHLEYDDKRFCSSDHQKVHEHSPGVRI
jgi:hypothetical protein